MPGEKDMHIVRLDAVTPAVLAAISRGALDRPLLHLAELLVAVPSSEAIVLGSTQRFCELCVSGAAPPGRESLVTRRVSGGGEAHVGPGTVWIQLALSSPSALVACEPSRLCNRYVRPLLRALTKLGALAHYFDRDWVSASKAPVASVSFAHDTETGRAVFEAFIAVETPFAARERVSFLGKPARTLRALGVDVDASRVADAVIRAYGDVYGIASQSRGDAPQWSQDLDDPRTDAPWASTRAEAIGVVAAGRDRDGRMRVGGELMVSRDALARLEREIDLASGDPARLDAAVDALAAPGVALLGVRDMRSLRDVIDEAWVAQAL